MRLLLARRHLALLLCAAALLMKLGVPPGYMIGGDMGAARITLCTGTATPPADAIAAASAAAAHIPAHPGKAPGHGGVDHPCAFAGLSAATTHAADAMQIAALVAFVLATGLAVVPLPAPRAAAFLHPPQRGPPIPA